MLLNLTLNKKQIQLKKKKVWHDAVTHCKGQGLPVTMTPVAGESTRFEKSCRNLSLGLPFS